MADEHDEFFAAPTHQPKEGTMHLEAQLAELNTNLKALIAVLAGGASIAAPAAGVASAKTPPPNPKPAAEKPASGPLDYEKDVKPLALKVAKDKGREALVKLNTEFGVAQANLLKPEQYEKFIAACNAALK